MVTNSDPANGAAPIASYEGMSDDSAQVSNKLDMLCSESTDIQTKITILQDLKAAREPATSQHLESNSDGPDIVEPILKLLTSTPPSFVSGSPTQRLRMLALEILHRLPFDEALRKHVASVGQLVLELLRIDNEDVAGICLKIFVDLHRGYKSATDDLVQPFLDIVLQMYKNMPGAVRDVFDRTKAESPSSERVSTAMSAESPAAGSSAELGEDNSVTSSTMLRGMHSFKVMTECPIIIVLVFATYRQIVHQNLFVFTPAIIDMLALKTEVQEAAARESAPETVKKQLSLLQSRPAFGDFILAQIKTLSFLAYVIRGFVTFMRKYTGSVPQFVLRLLQDCPAQMSSARKELLVATRHILSTEFRSAFVPMISTLLDENTLIGTGVTARETLRPLAYSMLADLIHNVRTDLTTAQIRTAIEMYIRNLLDPALVVTIQTMSAKLLLNMVDRIMKIQSQPEARQLIMRILEGFADKLESFETHSAGAADDHPSDPREAIRTAAIAIGPVQPETDGESLKETRLLFKNCVLGLKTILFGLKNCNPPAPGALAPAVQQHWNDAVRGLSARDVDVFVRLFLEGCRGLSYYRADAAAATATQETAGKKDGNSTDLSAALLAPATHEEKDVLETFATIFVHIDPATFQEIFERALPAFFDMTLKNTTLLYIPQYFLTNDAVSANFMGLLLHYQLERLDELGLADSLKTSVMLRLFRMCFMAVTMYPEQNEVILQPHLARIIIQAMKLSAEAATPLNFYILLRSLFRSIGGGRFELLYKEVLPLLQVLLECLNVLLQSARRQQEKELYVELCLTVPVRLSVLLPYLSYLMRPLVLALRAGPDLVTQGLRTLELCIDNLTQEFMDPILAPVLNDLMQALWSHLRPLPHSHHHSHPALRILGKMGGRNRRFLTESQRFDVTGEETDLPTVQISFLDSEKELPLGWTKFLPLCQRALQDHRIDLAYKENAFRVFACTVKLFLSKSAGIRRDDLVLVRDFARSVADPSGTVSTKALVIDNMAGLHARSIVPRVRTQERVFQEALSGVFTATSTPELRDRARTLLAGVGRHFTILHVFQSYIELARKQTEFGIETIEESEYMSTSAVGQVLVDMLANETQEPRLAATAIIDEMWRTAAVLLDDSVTAAQLPFFSMITTRLCHCCFQEHWYKKASGVAGLAHLAKKLKFGSSWARAHLTDITKALLFVIKDTPVEVATASVDEATELLEVVVRTCFDGTTADEASMVTLTGLLIAELANPNKRVRATVQTLLELLSRCTDTTIEKLLQPLQERLLTPIFTKPLRALPFAMQIGHIDAITYCLSLDSSFLPFNDELMRLLHEALALADAEDEQLVSVNRTSQYKSSSALVSLRVVCIKLLTIAVSAEEFAAAQQAQSRGRIIAVFFKSLYSKSPEVVEVANRGLKQVLNQNHKLPKDLLQAGLRPILMNLSDHKRLTVPGLEGLARLLELLTNYFKVEIGRKLLDHLKAWADASTLQQLAGRPLDDQQNIKVISAIINIFHLLPSSAHMFMDDLVSATIELEGHLRRTSRSPLRRPLLKFINKYPQETYEYFKLRIEDVRVATFLIQLIQADESDATRQVIANDIAALTGTTGDEKHIASMKKNLRVVISVVTALTSHRIPQAMDKSIWRRLLDAYSDSVRDPSSRDLDFHVHKHVNAQALNAIAITMLQHNPDDFDLMLQAMRAQAAGTLPTSEKLQKLFTGFVSTEGPIDKQRSLVLRSLGVFPEKNISAAFKIKLFQNIINPLILQHAGDKRPPLVDKTVIDAVHVKVWRVALADFGVGLVCSSDSLKMEILQMSTLLVRYHAPLLADIRKDIIKFAWNYIKLDDVTTKNAAYVFISHFIATYETPAKIAAQIFVALLRAGQPEARVLVRQALDVLAPVLSTRMPASESSASTGWIKYPRRVLVEESNAMQLIPALQFIVRHSELVFDDRHAILAPLIFLVPKLGLPGSATIESRSLSLEIIETILRWEERVADAMDTGDPDAHSLPSPSTAQRGAMLDFLIKLALQANDAAKGRPLARITHLFQSLLKLEGWTVDLVDVKMLESAVRDITDKTLPISLCSLELLAIYVTASDAEAVRAKQEVHLETLEIALKHATLADSSALPIILAKLLQMELAPENDEQVEETALDLKNRLVQILQDGLLAGASLSGSLKLVQTLAETRADIIDRLIPTLMKAFNNLVKDHVSPRPAGNQVSSSGAPASTGGVEADGNAADQDASTGAILVLMEILKERMLQLGDHRRFYLAALAQLIDKSPSREICQRILTLVTEILLKKRDALPTTKEKVSLLLKMQAFETRGDAQLLNQFLELVINVYQDPTVTRTEMTVRLEAAFLLGTRANDYQTRSTFMSIFNSSMARSVHTRFNYVFGVQNWEPLSNYFWITQANQLLIGSVATDRRIAMDASSSSFRIRPTAITETSGILDDALEKLGIEQEDYEATITDSRACDLLEGLCQLQYLDPNAAHMLWCTVMPMAWRAMARKDRHEASRVLTLQLSKEYNLRQVERRPNVIQTILTAASKCEPPIVLPPHLVKYLGKTYDAWFPAMDMLERDSRSLGGAQATGELQASTNDALTELYAALGEEDMFYGIWRRRCRYLETNAAISYEQNGMWDKSQQMYEAAQIKARTGVLPFSEPEYCLWEDHWILCAQKLQQWDVLTDLAKQEGYSDLLLECAWRVSDWTTDRDPLEASIKALMDVPTPRRFTFEAFMTLQKTQAKLETIQEFHRVCDEGMQLALRKWHQLPSMISQTHVPLLQTFQQFVELHEASQIYHSLSSTHAQNLETKSHELKHILQTWRERLPNFCDDINSWSDLVAWRQLVFSAINRVYLPLVPALQAPTSQGSNSSATSFAYRGYHETAWIINRFAHVARKHQLPEVCINQLTKIYTLPNIEIQEAFLKLREQAKCHFQNPNELGLGLEVISNTNLMYFGTQQKAEFFTLKGMFLAKMKLNDEANQAFATAIQIDLMLPKAWAEWGQYSDRLFQEDPSELTKAGNAVSCYLQAAGLYKNGRARKMLSRVLWLLSLDDAHGTISGAFDSYKGDVPTWYWITFIPQLLTSLSHKEARHARQILIRIAKTFPQALHFQLRTTKEDYAVIKKQAAAAAASAAGKNDARAASATNAGAAGKSDSPSAPGEPVKAEHEAARQHAHDVGANESSSGGSSESTKKSSAGPAASSQLAQAPGGKSNGTQSPRPLGSMQNRQPWEHVDEIMAILKTAYPLLALSMETMVDQIQQRFKCQADEDAYRLIVALLNDGVQYIGRLGSVTEDTKLPPATQANITRFADSVLPKNIKAAFEKEFVREPPNLQEYVSRLRKWRDKFEAILDRRSDVQQLEQFSSYLSEFQFQKFDEVEIPGQYLQHRDNNNDFVRIDRFLPTLDVVRGHGICYRRITVRGHDGSLHPFAIQYPAARHCRREERIIQLFRILSGVLARRKESRKRGLTFNLPAAVPLAPHIRIVQDDPAYVSLQSVYEDYCTRQGQHKDEPLRLAANRIQKMGETAGDRQELVRVKIRILEEIQRDLVPDTIVLDYFRRTFADFADFWRFRKQFSLQYASLTFMTYVMNINNRFPHKLFVSRKTGQVWGTEILPGMAQNNPVFHNAEAVPFRFTPTLQNLMGPTAVEGIYSCAIMAIGRCLTEPEFELDQHLSIFVRDELITWFTQQHRPVTHETQLREKVAANVDLIVRRASSLSQVAQGNLPAHQTIIDLISQAVNPKNLAQMDQLWSPFL